uniref:START domain-containing protein n=1 Tax=Mucochytrium quahogii TaxID=96639 RepID=A0A7S2S6T3_9STRA|mmetsp:Transcript_19898/g.32738  ORF Transcript_19898/g.32738 Transcript_19898/m.32738 type:complete len:335 (+) Transcript_19898:126-1130(+)
MDQFSVHVEDVSFSLFFCLASFDLWLHGPVESPVKYVGLAASVTAVAFGEFDGFIVAQVVWLVCILYGVSTTEKVVKAVKEEEKVAEPVGEPVFPDIGKKRLEESLNKFLANLAPAKNCDNKEWVLNKESGPIKVFSSELSGKSTKRWKVLCEVSGATLQELAEEIMNFEVRASSTGGWDVAVKAGKVVFSYRDGYSLSTMVTAEAVGGAISSREFIDIRWKLAGGEHPSAPEGGLLVTNVGVEPKKDKKWLPQIPKPDSSYILGCTYPGGGIRMTPIPGRKDAFKYEMVNNMDIKGWVPTSAVNSATASALLDSHTAMLAHLAKKFGSKEKLN